MHRCQRGDNLRDAAGMQYISAVFLGKDFMKGSEPRAAARAPPSGLEQRNLLGVAVVQEYPVLLTEAPMNMRAYMERMTLIVSQRSTSFPCTPPYRSCTTIVLDSGGGESHTRTDIRGLRVAHCCGADPGIY